jgi:4-aminobutyrate aminotransferase-like enzyme/Ser/Thr protein kinase RdoA (MazF antagonist)
VTAIDPLALLTSPPPEVSIEEIQEVLQRHYGLNAPVSLLPSERDQNVLVAGHRGQRVLKIANEHEPAAQSDLQVAVLRYLAVKAPHLPVPRVVRSTDGATIVEIIRRDGSRHRAWMVTFLPGTPARATLGKPLLPRVLGCCLAELDVALQGFSHPAARRVLGWNISLLPSFVALLEHVRDPVRRTLVETAFARVVPVVQQRLFGLRAQAVHNDLNPSNVLLAEGPSPQVTGILDFGDVVHAALVANVAIGAAYQAQDAHDPLAGVAAFVAGYESVTPLLATERAVLVDLVMARLVSVVLLTHWRASRFPANRDYLLRNVEPAWSLLNALSTVPVALATERVFASQAAHPRRDAVGLAPAMMARRSHLLGAAYRLFYNEPLQLVRGEGAYLYDPHGKRYLDLYNNVAHVGHCHQRVVAAIARQAAVLNTHTRYLHEMVLQYAQRLTATFPRPLSQLMLTCTGSEANELALRVARAATGARGVIVSSYAYHGNTTQLAEMSAGYYPTAEGRGPTVRTIVAPDRYFDTAPLENRKPTDFLASIAEALDSLQQAGMGVAAFMVDPHFTSDGILAPAPPYLAEAVELVRAAGGLFISDEVQAGFGRLGTHFWAFDAHGVVPDLVTLGKPMANGHPVGGVVARPDLLTAFAQTSRYFNTYGGNPVSCAAALATLDVIEEEGLQENAQQVGGYLVDRLRSLAASHPLIGDIRGSGLFIGVELVRERETRAPATEETLRVVNELRARGMLTSHIGPRGNVLKIRPPLILATEQVDEFVTTLDAVLQEI